LAVRWLSATGVSTALVVCGLLPAGKCLAWVYPEHREITLVAVAALDSERRATLDRLWAQARTGHETRLCANAAEPEQETPQCLDWAAWPAISGDHSCSGSEMLQTVLHSSWILAVARIAARLERDLESATSQPQRINRLRNSDILLQRADPDYATRAQTNDAHFLLPVPSPGTTGRDYLATCLRTGAGSNAVGVYAWYHRAALAKAARLARPGLAPETASRLALAALADEAFALHFLQDSFAAGHLVGSWGSASKRKGTHDYYGEHGLERPTWTGGDVVVMGDANIRPEDQRLTAQAVDVSLNQLLDAARGRLPIAREAQPAPESLDVCNLQGMPPGTADEAVEPLWIDVLRSVPRPALAEGVGALPRFRSELGPFFGVSAAALVSWIDGGFASTQKANGAEGAVEVGLRIGYGLEGVMDEAGDGLVSLDLRIRQDTASSMDFSQAPDAVQAGAITAAIPPRTGFVVRVRMPFWLIPGDLLLALPVHFIAPRTYARMAVTAANGGLIPWQAGISTRAGRLQFVLGRELGVAFDGFLKGKDRMLMPAAEPGAAPRLVALRSIAFEFPVLEYRPVRSFALNQASILALQLFAGFDVAENLVLLGPAGAPPPDTRTIVRAGARITFDWRHY
jgi:hypothetical protein